MYYLIRNISAFSIILNFSLNSAAFIDNNVLIEDFERIKLYIFNDLS